MYISEEQVKDNLETGLVLAIEEKRKELLGSLENLSKKELKRLLENVARFPEPRVPSGGFGKSEATATETIYAIKDLQLELGIVTLARKQEENDNSKGEDNE